MHGSCVYVCLCVCVCVCVCVFDVTKYLPSLSAEMGGACGAYGGGERGAQVSGGET